MKGNNELRWNEATIIEAVQEYLDKRYTPKVRVVAVAIDGTSYQASVFVVKVEEIQEEKPT